MDVVMSGRAIDQDVTERLDRLRSEQGEMVHFDRVVVMVGEIIEHMWGATVRNELVVKDELEGLSSYIRDLKAEVAAVRADEIQDTFLPSATDELDAIVEATEVATNSILGAAETISEIACELEGTISDRLNDVTTVIYEACTFQDITGQRISKIVKALKVVESRIERLAKAFGSDIDEMRRASTGNASSDPSDDSRLLNGPQLSANANQQGDIDALFAG